MDYYINRTNDELAPFTTLTSLNPVTVARFAPTRLGPDDPPAFLRLIVAPVQPIDFNGKFFLSSISIADSVWTLIATTRKFQRGDLVGVMVVVRILNGLDSFWNSMVEAFGSGYYGMRSCCLYVFVFVFYFVSVSRERLEPSLSQCSEQKFAF